MSKKSQMIQQSFQKALSEGDFDQALTLQKHHQKHLERSDEQLIAAALKSPNSREIFRVLDVVHYYPTQFASNAIEWGRTDLVGYLIKKWGRSAISEGLIMRAAHFEFFDVLDVIANQKCGDTLLPDIKRANKPPMHKVRFGHAQGAAEKALANLSKARFYRFVTKYIQPPNPSGQQDRQDEMWVKNLAIECCHLSKKEHVEALGKILGPRSDQDLFRFFGDLLSKTLNEKATKKGSQQDVLQSFFDQISFLRSFLGEVARQKNETIDTLMEKIIRIVSEDFKKEADTSSKPSGLGNFQSLTRSDQQLYAAFLHLAQNAISDQMYRDAKASLGDWARQASDNSQEFVKNFLRVDLQERWAMIDRQEIVDHLDQEKLAGSETAMKQKSIKKM